jgi:peptidoglycan hydrolase CwlO-like protein
MIEITSFVLGMLTVGAALMLITLVAGIVKINKLEKQNSHNEKQFEQVYDNMCRQDNEVRQLLDSTNRDINMVEKTIMNQVQQIDQEHHKIEDEIHREIDQTKSYIDSRIDKVVASGVLKEPTRQTING